MDPNKEIIEISEIDIRSSLNKKQELAQSK